MDKEAVNLPISDKDLTKTGGRAATQGVIQGQVALSVGNPQTPCPPGWTWTALTDVARLETGHTPSRKHPEWWGGDVPWIGIKDATGNHGRKIYETIQYTNDQGIANSSARILPPNTVCLSRTASVGYVVVMGVPMATSQDFVNWVCGPDLDWRYLKYVLLSETESLKRFSYGTTHQTIYFPEVKAFHVCLPPIEEQRRIADILSALDDKIEVNRQMAATLEEIARAVFRSWFVDFDPVRAKVAAKAEGRDPERAAMAALGGKSEADLDALLPEALAFLTALPIPDELERTEDLDVPHGWQVERLSAITSFLSRGLTPSYVEEDGMLVLNQRCVRPDGIDLAPARRHDALKRAPKERTLQIGDVLVNSTGVGTLGRVAQVLSLPEPATVDSHVTIVRTDDMSMQHFLGLLLESRQNEIEELAEGTTGQTELSRTKLGELRCFVPSTEMIKAFNEVVAPLRLAADQKRRENLTLARLRATLLPKLLSGELQLAAVEAVVA